MPRTSSIRIKLKWKLENMTLQMTTSHEWSVELFDAVQYIYARIKSANALLMLESDVEHINIVTRLLSPEDLKLWLVKDNQSWSSLYSFLEHLYDIECKAIRILAHSNGGTSSEAL